MDRSFEVMKRGGMVILHLLILLGLLSGHAWLIYTNFTALKVSFELAGYDGTPLGDDLLTGPLWEAFGLYELTQAHMFAAAIAFFVGFLSAVVFHHLYLAVRLLMDRKEYVRIGDTASVEQAKAAIIRNLAVVCLILIPLVPVAYWDLMLFRFRSVAPILGMENNAIEIKDWPILLQQSGDLFAFSLARYGGLAYIMLVAGASLAVELWINFLREALVRLGTALQGWFEYLSGSPTVGNVAAANRPTQEEPYNTQQPIGSQSNHGPVNAEDNPLTHNADENSPRSEASEKGATNGFSSETDSIEWPEKRTSETTYTSTFVDEANIDDEVMVYGGLPGEKIKFSVAAAETDNYFIDEMRRVWRRSFNSDEDQGQPEAA